MLFKRAYFKGFGWGLVFLAPTLHIVSNFFIHKLSLGAHFLVPNLNSNATKQDVSPGSGCIKLH